MPKADASRAAHTRSKRLLSTLVLLLKCLMKGKSCRRRMKKSLKKRLKRAALSPETERPTMWEKGKGIMKKKFRSHLDQQIRRERKTRSLREQTEER